jgi:outer membrane lipoprotein-sorting protein
MKKIFSLIIICLFTKIATTLGANNESAIWQFKNYLSEIDSVAIDFTQEDSRSHVAYGKLLINKPYRFRCNYYEPFPLVIIGNKNFVSVYDYDMEHVSRIKPAENIFNFLLEHKATFDKNFVFESIIDENNIFKTTIYHNLTGNHIEVSFNKSTKQICTIKIFEDDNIINITFNNIVKVQKFSDDLFKLKNPEVFGPPERLTKSGVEKKYIAN